MKIKGWLTKETEIEITLRELGYTLMEIVLTKIKSRGNDFVDDAGCDWFTNKNGETFIGGDDWQISSDKNVACLVDAANVLFYGKPLRLDK